MPVRLFLLATMALWVLAGLVAIAPSAMPHPPCGGTTAAAGDAADPADPAVTCAERCALGCAAQILAPMAARDPARRGERRGPGETARAAGIATAPLLRPPRRTTG